MCAGEAWNAKEKQCVWWNLIFSECRVCVRQRWEFSKRARLPVPPWNRKSSSKLTQLKVKPQQLRVMCIMGLHIHTYTHTPQTHTYIHIYSPILFSSCVSLSNGCKSDDVCLCQTEAREMFLLIFRMNTDEYYSITLTFLYKHKQQSEILWHFCQIWQQSDTNSLLSRCWQIVSCLWLIR